MPPLSQMRHFQMRVFTAVCAWRTRSRSGAPADWSAPLEATRIDDTGHDSQEGPNQSGLSPRLKIIPVCGWRHAQEFRANSPRNGPIDSSPPHTPGRSPSTLPCNASRQPTSTSPSSTGHPPHRNRAPPRSAPGPAPPACPYLTAADSAPRWGPLSNGTNLVPFGGPR